MEAKITKEEFQSAEKIVVDYIKQESKSATETARKKAKEASLSILSKVNKAVEFLKTKLQD